MELTCEVVRIHHLSSLDIVTDSGKLSFMKMSPWYFPTSAGYSHQLFLTYNSFYSGLLEENLSKEEFVRRADYAAENNWCKLTPMEYYFDKLALRGGRTEVRRHYYKGECNYDDYQSMYPALQTKIDMELCGEKIDILYPVGPPTMEIWDKDYYPCDGHFTTPNEICTCSYESKKSRNSWQYKKSRIIEVENGDIDELINSFGTDHVGILMVDVTPPKDLYHPVLPVMIEVDGYKKCVYSLDPIVKGTYTSPELQLAVRKGYVITKVYRVHRYKAAYSKWGEFMKILYLSKMRNSTVVGDDEWKERLMKIYKEEFDMDVDYDEGVWEKNDVLKLASKGPLNSAWGKHAESVDHDTTLVMSRYDDQGCFQFHSNVVRNHYNVSSFTCVGDLTIFKYTENREYVKPKLKNSYLPAAVFVPSYGRLLLYNDLDKLGERVIMCDTDSLIYTKAGGPPLVTGDSLGKLEKEPGNIVEFVALAPKSYGLGYDDGSTIFKTKGVCLKRGSKEFLNFDKAKEMVLDGVVVSIPQMRFDYSYGNGMKTIMYEKIVKFDVNSLKGPYDVESHKVFPFGFVR